MITRKVLFLVLPLSWAITAAATPGNIYVRLGSAVVVGTAIGVAIAWFVGHRAQIKAKAAAARSWVLWDRRRLIITSSVTVGVLGLLVAVYTVQGIHRVQTARYEAQKDAYDRSVASSTATPSPTRKRGVVGAELPPSTTPSPSPTAKTSTPRPSTAKPTPTPAASSTAAPTSPQLDAASAVATRFVTAWARPTVPAKLWILGLKPVTTPEFATSLATVDPSNVPASRVTGAVIPVEVAPTWEAPTEIVVQIPTNGGALDVTLTGAATTWRVNGIDKASTDPGH